MSDDTGRRNLVVSAFALALAAGAALLVMGPLRDQPVPIDGFALPWWVLALLFAVTELVVVSVQVRRESMSISFAEVPLVIGLVFCGPVGFLAASVLGSAVGLLHHRQRGLKLLFNLALFAFEAALAKLVYSAALAGGDPVDLRGFVAAVVTIVVTQAVSALALTVVIYVMVGEYDEGVWREAMTSALVAAVANSSVGLLVVLLVTTRPSALVLLLLVVGALVLAYRGYSRLSRGHARLESLYRFTGRLGGAVRTDDVIEAVLGEARDVLTAEVAELHLLQADGRPGGTVVLGPDGVVRSALAPRRSWWSGALQGTAVLRSRGGDSDGDLRDGMAAPLRVDDDVVGVLLVRDRPYHLDTFGESDVRLFTSLANHAALSLQKADLVDRLAAEAALQEHRSLHDSLTGLPNRRRFLEVLDEHLRREPAAAVVMLDLDGFTDVNDAFGHGVGDALLAEVGRRLTAVLGGEAVARLGNDEFAVLLRDAGSTAEATERARRLLEALAVPFPVDGFEVHIRATAGVACAPVHGSAAEPLLQHADTALYAAKQGRREIEVYAPAADGAGARLLMTGHLRDAIERGALDVHFQPKVEPRTGRPVGAEALVRWHHPAHGQVSPDAFVPLAEHAGLIRPLTEFVLGTALRALAGWRAGGREFGVAVNLSARSLTDPGLPRMVAAALAAADVPADALTLEITETVVMSDIDRALAVMGELRALGVHLSVDDFGTGQSSLAYLQRLPIDEVKIDKSFVLHLADERDDSAIARAAVDLGHALKLRVVAEGVEDARAQLLLASWGCDLVQGFAISRPLPQADLTRWLDRFAAGEGAARLSAVGV